MKHGTPCHYCGSPAKGRPCWYERSPFEKHDPPCAREARAAAALTQRRWDSLANFVAGLSVVLALALIWFVART